LDRGLESFRFLASAMVWESGMAVIAKGEEGIGNETRGSFERIRQAWIA
jgi:hypothetical protein